MNILRTNFNTAVMVLAEIMELEAREESNVERLTMLENKYEDLLWEVSRVKPGMLHKIDQILVDTAENVINGGESDIEMNYEWGFDRLKELLDDAEVAVLEFCLDWDIPATQEQFDGLVIAYKNGIKEYEKLDIVYWTLSNLV